MTWPPTSSSITSRMCCRQPMCHRGSKMRFLTMLAFLCGRAWTCNVVLPQKPDALRFAVMGDNGTGERPQYEVAEQMKDCHDKFAFQFVLMNGDNLYGGESPHDFQKKFEVPYKSLLDSGVKFFASLGNHDNPNQRSYKLFQMGGERFYSFAPGKDVRFFALDSNYMDEKQLQWLEKMLKDSGEKWKIAFFHHPLYSSGATHGSDLPLRS